MEPVPLTAHARADIRWLMLGLLWLAYASFGLTAGTIPPLVEPIIHDLGMTYSQMGLVLGAWQLIYIVTAMPLGAMLDWLGVRRALGIGIGIVWISLILRGLAVDFPSLFASVALFGLGAPIISIGAPKVVAIWFTGKERGLAAGIYTTAPITGMALALATGPNWIIELTGSWRGTSLVYGAFILLVFILWWIFARDQEEPNPQLSDNLHEKLPTAIKTLLQIRNMQIILVVAIITFLLNHGLNNWVPTLLLESGYSMSNAGSLTAIATASGVFGLLFIPRLAIDGRRRLILGALIVVCCATTAGLAIFSGPILISTVFLSVIVRVPLMPISTLILMETRGIGARRMGRAGGMFFAAAEIGGFGGPFLLGYMRDISGSLTTGVITLAIVTIILLLFIPLIRENEIEMKS